MCIYLFPQDIQLKITDLDNTLTNLLIDNQLEPPVVTIPHGDFRLGNPSVCDEILIGSGWRKLNQSEMAFYKYWPISGHVACSIKARPLCKLHV